jgi:hypothetical protein
VWSPDLAPLWPLFFTNVGPTGVVIIAGGVGRCVVTNVGPMLVQIVPVARRSWRSGRVGQDAVTRGVVREDQEGSAG